MKAANALQTPGQVPQNPPTTPKYGNTTRVHYIMMAALLALASLFSSWLASAPSSISAPQTWSGLALLWLGGGLLTLFLLALAARR